MALSVPILVRRILPSFVLLSTAFPVNSGACPSADAQQEQGAAVKGYIAAVHSPDGFDVSSRSELVFHVKFRKNSIILIDCHRSLHLDVAWGVAHHNLIGSRHDEQALGIYNVALSTGSRER
jgi:hypothetical protein